MAAVRQLRRGRRAGDKVLCARGMSSRTAVRPALGKRELQSYRLLMMVRG